MSFKTFYNSPVGLIEICGTENSIRSYMEITKILGDQKAIRAVANANGQNKISIIIPCHRVIGSDGSLTGYGGGLWRKKWLLEHEQKFSNTEKQLELTL